MTDGGGGGWKKPARKRRTGEKALSAAAVSQPRPAAPPAGLPAKKPFLCRFAAETNCRLPHFHDLYKSRHLCHATPLTLPTAASLSCRGDGEASRRQLLRYRHYSPMQRENKQKNADKISDILHITCTTIYSSSIKQPMAPVIFATIHQRQIIGFHGESASRAERKIDQAILVGRPRDRSLYKNHFLFFITLPLSRLRLAGLGRRLGGPSGRK